MKYYLFDHAGSLNRGCEAIIRGTLNIVSSADDDASFTLASYRPESDTALNLNTVKMETREMTAFEKIISALKIKLTHSEKYYFKKTYSPVIKNGEKNDICLSIGGDTYCYGDNASTRVITEELHKKHKKVVLWGASIGEEDLSQEKIEGLKNFDAVFAREPLTFELLGRYVDKDKLFMFSDPAFCMEKEELPLPDGFEPNKTIGFNLSPLVVDKNPALLPVCTEFLKAVISNTDFQVALIPHVTENGNDDCTVLDKIYDELDCPQRVVKIPGNLNAKQYKGYITRCRMFIGARTHATIAAYWGCVPTIVLGYSVKSRGIAKDLFGKEMFVVDSLNLTKAEELISQFTLLAQHEEEIREILRCVIPQKIESSMEAGKQLLKL
ncbi:MAG: polysaccharide pyruvyl transferase family protein [Clostridia bacterium]|nr:polysaccharide pyruvyl transferase family protein [Clostridia bacterium]